jgi:hypothetical protein
MTPIDQIKPPASMPPTLRIKRKDRSARDSNREQREKRTERSSERDKSPGEHIDKLI